MTYEVYVITVGGRVERYSTSEGLTLAKKLARRVRGKDGLGGIWAPGNPQIIRAYVVESTTKKTIYTI
jgi:hypothetical protein